MESSKVSIKRRSTPASLSFKGQATKQTTVKVSIEATTHWWEAMFSGTTVVVQFSMISTSAYLPYSFFNKILPRCKIVIRKHVINLKINK